MCIVSLVCLVFYMSSGYGDASGTFFGCVVYFIVRLVLGFSSLRENYERPPVSRASGAFARGVVPFVMAAVSVVFP